MELVFELLSFELILTDTTVAGTWFVVWLERGHE